ncbi:helix-loop-helix protein lin-22-like [Diabrotica virgifera virgifera]|uniref:Transcription factor HES-2-like n=1 Tax=Diabrotica virgifera virgifera TaxID=50390 RepID=A0A6P7GJA5_DIAVI|nr:helix-loop-helix protein lin-22-like [Diabrotica virgifera virgifera]
MKTEIRKPPSESRKIRKPIMEKKRRARINDSLETLKQILLQSKTDLQETKKGQRTAKLEKADILEMTVQYLQQLQEKDKENQSKLVSVKQNFPVSATLMKKVSNQQKPLRICSNSVNKEPVAIRPADSSSEKVNFGVRLLPTQLISGQVVYLLPSNLNVNNINSNYADSKDKVWRPW